MLGSGSGVNLGLSNNIAIGNTGLSPDSGVTRIGAKWTHTAAVIFGIAGVTISGGIAVQINANGQLGTVFSSRRFKSSILDMGNASGRLMNLRPVIFRYKKAAENGSRPLQYGLVAEEVSRVYPDLVQYDAARTPFTVYYHLLTPMLLNEVQKVHVRSETRERELNAIVRSQATETRQLTGIRLGVAALKAGDRAGITALKAGSQNQSVELASYKRLQAQHQIALARLSALIEASRIRPQIQTAALRHR